ncbi:MAG: GNAT family N-acetyltransferase [Bacteroidales bacterium]|nr:GNAT family N-acetyltransferase [Bacteroidales bacterium]
MIQLANNSSRQQVWNMWKRCFGDPDNYMELYFRDKYRPENTLLYMEGTTAVASLQMLDYKFSFHGKEIPVIYLSGVCTLPEYRKRGYTRALLIEGFNVAKRRGVPLMLLVPQEKWLMELYAKYGFARAFDPGTAELPSLKELMSKHRWNLREAYNEFDRYYRKQDMTVQKTFDDFKAIVDEGALFDFPPKKNLIGMARVIDAQYLLSLFDEGYKGKPFAISVKDELIEENNIALPAQAEATGHVAIQVDIGDLAQLLLGYHTGEREEPYSKIFPEKSPVMNFMLE